MKHREKKRSILIGLTGSIAVYKIPLLVSLLVQRGYRIRIALSESAKEFASLQTLEILSGQKVISSLWDSVSFVDPEQSPVLHIALVEESDIFLVAPASYNWIGKVANGIADDLLSTLYAAWPLGEKPLLFAPAMNPSMWKQLVLQENIAKLEKSAAIFVPPQKGFLACRADGQGRMCEVEELFFRIDSLVRKLDGIHSFLNVPLCGKKMVITAGATREFLDPVRYISNCSSGKMGIAIACAARDLGAEVCLISSLLQTADFHRPMEESAPPRLEESFLLAQKLYGVRVLNCNTAREMATHAAAEFETSDWGLAVAAVGDFRAAAERSSKIKKKKEVDRYQIDLVLNPDILSNWGREKNSRQKVLGFALEVCGIEGASDLVNQVPCGVEIGRSREREAAVSKLYEKRADAIVWNSQENVSGKFASGELLLRDAGLCAAAENGGYVSHRLSRQSKEDFAVNLLLLLSKEWL